MLTYLITFQGRFLTATGGWTRDRSEALELEARAAHDAAQQHGAACVAATPPDMAPWFGPHTDLEGALVSPWIGG